MVQLRVGAFRRPIGVALVCSAMLLIGLGQVSARADVTAVSGSAYGYFSNVGLFGGAPSAKGPAPTVTLPAGGSASPVTATAPSAIAQYGPAIIFSSGQLDVSTQGTTGTSGSVTSSSAVQNVNTPSQGEPFTAAKAASTCTASQTGDSGSTTITNGTLQTSEGNPNVTGDETVVAIPTNPAPNTTYTGAIESVGDTFRYVFNEQIVNPDGSITVNAAHQFLLGPTAVGDLIIGQSKCGVTRTPDMTAPETTIDSGPSGTISSDSASFEFSSSEVASTFECKLDGPGTTTGSYGSCSSPKTYSSLANGSYTFSVRATDRASNTDATAATRTFTVTPPTPPPPPPPPPSPSPPPTPDTVAPVVSSLSASPKVFAVASGRGARATRTRAHSTTFNYQLSESSTVRFTIQRKTTGRRVSKKSCRKQTKVNRKRRACVLYVSLGTLSQNGVKGKNKLTFSGRLGGRKLRPGSYRALVVATDTAGNRSRTRSASFTIVRK